MAPSIAQTAAALAALPAGTRAGCWLADDIAAAAVPLLISPLSSDPGSVELARQVAAQGAGGQRGVLFASEDGTVKMGVMGATGPRLGALARWVRENVGEHPGLAHLVGAELLDVATDGSVRARFARDKLWRDLPRPAAPSIIEETAKVLSEMEPGDQAWFWLSKRGPGGKALLSLVADAATFHQRARSLERRAPEAPRIRGVAKMTASGTLVLISDDDNPDWHRILVSVRLAYGKLLPALRAITSARLVVRRGTSLAYRGRPLAGKLDLSRDVAVLETLSEAAAWFWMTTADTNGQPMLLLDADRDALKARAQAVGGHGVVCQGRVRGGDSGLEFQARRPFGEDFSLWVRRFAADHRRHWPALKSLRGAQLVVA